MVLYVKSRMQKGNVSMSENVNVCEYIESKCVHVEADACHSLNRAKTCNEFCGVWQLISIYNKTHHNLSGVVAAAHVNMAHKPLVAFLTVSGNAIHTQKIHYGFDYFIDYRVLNGT